LQNFENGHDKITKGISQSSCTFLFDRIYRNQRFQFIRNIFKFSSFFSILEIVTGSPVISFSDVVMPVLQSKG
jgi:hypothetical protein